MVIQQPRDDTSSLGIIILELFSMYCWIKQMNISISQGEPGFSLGVKEDTNIVSVPK